MAIEQAGAWLAAAGSAIETFREQVDKLIAEIDTRLRLTANSLPRPIDPTLAS